MLRTRRPFALLAALIAISGCGSASPGGTVTASAAGGPNPTPGPTIATPSLPVARAISSTAIDLQAGGHDVTGLAASGDAIWALTDAALVRIDPVTRSVTKRIDVPNADQMAISDGSAWVTDFDASLVHRLDLTTGREVATIAVGTNPEGIVAAFGAIWTADHRGGSVTRIDPAANTVVATVDKVGRVGRSGPQGISAGGDRIWVDVSNVSQVIGIDPATNAVVATVTIDARAVPCGGILVDGATLWVSSCGERWNVTLVDPGAGSATIVSLPGYSGLPVLIGDTIWVPAAGSTDNPLMIAFRRDTSVADVVALPAGSVADGSVEAFGSLWIGGPGGTVLRISLDQLGG